MHIPLNPIALNETSHNVALLHATLEVLGFPVAVDEVKHQKAGPDTRDKVQALQAQLKIPADDTTLVSQATIPAVGDLLKQRGLTVARRSFTIAGTAQRPNGSPKKRQMLLAVDVDLRAMATYRSVTKLAELKRSAGFTPLGATQSDARGAYQITCYDWQYRRGDRQSAAIVVYAVSDGKNGRIVGHSRLVNTEDHAEKKLVRGQDVVVADPAEGTDYERVTETLATFLKARGTTLDALAKSAEQLSFTAAELDIPPERVRAAAQAYVLATQEQPPLSQTLLYGLGAQGIRLNWLALHKKSDAALRAAIHRSAKQQVIPPAADRAVTAFLTTLRQRAVKHLLDGQGNGGNPLNAMLSNALPTEAQRVAFLGAVASFSGADYADFWKTYLPKQPEFREKPELVANLLLTQQLTLITANHQPLVHELQVVRRISSAQDLLDLDRDAWVEIVTRSGTPPFVRGATEAERRLAYVTMLTNRVNACFPTGRIARLLAGNALPIQKPEVAPAMGAFLAKHTEFDIATSRVHDFTKQIKAVARRHAAEVQRELLAVQRVFQVSPTPEAMTGLLGHGLRSAHAIAGMPRKNFVRQYGPSVGGEDAALAIHQRASHIAARAELTAMHVLEHATGYVPQAAQSSGEYRSALQAIQNNVPNYQELVGRADVCECEHCRSVYSAAAYFVDLLRFLWRGDPNAEGRTPLQIFEQRRPDLVHLRLTCENTNTVIPYIDLASEVMEYYTVHNSLAGFTGHDTGDATAEELRANAQHFDLSAYSTLNAAKYPFTLPYHQPLDVIRTYSDHLQVARADVMRAVSPTPGATTGRAIAAETLRLSEEEYVALTGHRFDGTADGAPLYEYYGYDAAADLETLSAVPALLSRAGIAYTDLVALIKTRFINPHQGTLEFIQRIFSYGSLDPATLYAKLEMIGAGTLDPATDADIMAALTAYNADRHGDLTPAEFAEWVVAHLGEFRQVITLYEPQSRCDLKTTTLRTIESIYEDESTSGITQPTWSRLHRFIRLWRRLGWTIEELDVMLAAVGASDITPEAIEKLATVARVIAETRASVHPLATLWGNIDTSGEHSLYKKLFLNKAVQQIDDAFEPDASGEYLQNGELLGSHKSAILAAFRIRFEDLSAIAATARIIEGGAPRALDLATDALSLPNLSTIYRHVVLARALKLRVPELCTLIRLFDTRPFSTWNMDANAFEDVAPAATYDFYRLADAMKDARFKVPVLEYILTGTAAADSSIELKDEKIRRTAQAARDAFAVIEQAHPDAPPSPLTLDAVTGRLALTFQPDVVAQFADILSGTALFQAFAGANLAVVIPAALAGKYGYVKGSGRLTCTGVMSDGERVALKALADISDSFRDAVDELYEAPAVFVAAHFGGIFGDLPGANAVLLDHPAQTPAATLEERLAYVYAAYVPVLKRRLRRDALTQHIAALIGLSQEATAVLIERDIDGLITDLSTAGFSATYYSDSTWTTAALQRVDATVDFQWGLAAPDPLVPPDDFSARWDGFVEPPASGEYTLSVDVAEADEALRLYLDEQLVLEKPAGDARTSWEVVRVLNASHLHHLRLDYAETTQQAGVHLRWKTPTTATEALPAAATYPATVVEAFGARARVYHRAAKFISGFRLSETELDHLIRFAPDFDDIDFEALTPSHWRRVYEYTTLRDAVPQAQRLLTDVFAAANATNPAPTTAGLNALLHQATAWENVSLAFLIDTHFGLTVADFKNEIALNRVRDVMRIVAKSGLSAETVAAWGAPETDFNQLHDTAQLMKNAVKAKYEQTEWSDIGSKLSDGLRQRQQQALVAHLLTLPDIRAAGARDADGLFEHLLIDVQMDACMDTSRIVQANAAIQMFVNRCFLNLESDTTTDVERGVSPGALDKDRWGWMQNYRVWEANRKVFLYPENWLEPDWRRDRSEFFKELESYLVQNDITDRSVEQAFRNYLASLNEVANLEVCGMCREPGGNHTLKYLHVFARSQTAPYRFYYRRWNEFGKWSAWERVPVDIRCVEDGANSGVHLLPVVWKGRLFLFWPEWLESLDPAPQGSNESVEDVSNDPMPSLEPIKHWDLHLGCSEYVDAKWSPKQVSKRLTRLSGLESAPDLSRILLRTDVWPPSVGEPLVITVSNRWFMAVARIVLSSIQSPVDVQDDAAEMWPVYDWDNNEVSAYRFFFSGRSADAPLELMDDTYLNAPRNHRLLPLNTHANRTYDIELAYPFFYSDPQRTYFVRPVDITITEQVKRPFNYRILLPYLEDDHKWWAPPVGPDPIPPDVMRAEFAPAAPEFRFETDALSTARQPTPSSPLGAGTGTAVRPLALRTDTPATVGTGGQFAQSAGMTIGSMQAFGGLQQEMGVIWGWDTVARQDRGLEFHTFYHPFSNQYVTNLNQGGVSRGNKPATFPPGLMESDTSIPSDNGLTFEGTYAPNFDQGRVQKPADFAQRTYYKENICFDPLGANSLYNWELFFHAPLYIATRLSRNGKFAEAMKWFHYIFDPTTDEAPAAGDSDTARYWKVPPFKTTAAESLEELFRRLAPNTNPALEDLKVAAWRDNPFDAHLVASDRPLAYMKHVILKYVENLIAWGDSLFRRDTRESVNEALQIYVIANHILGPRPESVPRRGDIQAESFESLRTKLDDFSNALVELENIFPYSSETSISAESSGTNMLGVGEAFYFCIAANSKLLEYWDTVADRLFKIRHCQNIDGVERSLSLFAPAIEPGALIQAASQGLSLGSILADLSSPPPIHRCTFLLQKANEFCADVKALGSALLAALEKKDAEALGNLRATHEVQMLERMTAVRERNVLDAKVNKESLQRARETASFRLRHYIDLLGNDSVTVPAAPTLGATLNADSQLPADTLITTVKTDVDDAPVESGEAGVKVIPKEKEEIDKSDAAKWVTVGAGVGEAIAGIFAFFPNADGEGTPLGVGAGAWWGGQNLGHGMGLLARATSTAANFLSQEATQAARTASYIRREQEWTLQANLAAREIVQLDRQITSADIRIQIAEKELANHHQSIENSKAVESFLRDKFTNEELYQWMKEQLFSVYKQSYNLAYDMAKRAEKAYKYELGVETASFIQYGYWDNSRQGLTAGERLQLALRELERSYLDENRRHLELSKSISLRQLDPVALIQLRETGRCYVSVPEELFDLDFRGHYFRRLKSVRLSIPCVVGPYTSVSCSLHLLNNSVRINTSMNSEGEYAHENDEGVWIDDDRFRRNLVPVSAMATSRGQNDSGMFEFNFRDERYLPFEGAGVISEWQLELSTEGDLRPFDYSTIADVILHFDYTARESGGLFKQRATAHLRDFVTNAAELADAPLLQAFGMRHDFPSEWHRFLYPAVAGAEQILTFTTTPEHFAFLAHNRDVIVTKLDVFARCAQAADYEMILDFQNRDGDPVATGEITLAAKPAYGGLHHAPLSEADGGLDLAELDIWAPLSLRLKRATAATYTMLGTDPDEVTEISLVWHYRLG